MHDKLGPEYIIEVYDSQSEMRGILVIDNTLLGPGKGGLRMVPTITRDEVFRLARIMTLKNALFELPFGGAKAGIIWQGGDKAKKKRLIKAFARKIKFLTPKYYISAPDVNTGEEEMKWFVEEVGNWRAATGKPASLCIEILSAKDKSGKKIKCGIPHEFGSTGFGVAVATRSACKFLDLDISKAKIAIHGFGNVGSFTFKFLEQWGAKIVAICDSSACLFSPTGFTYRKLIKVIKNKLPLKKANLGQKISPNQFWSLKVDVLIPASVTDVINEQNKRLIKAKLIIEAGNIPMPDKIEEEFYRKGILIIPDFVANAGGVISSYAEYKGYNPKDMFKIIERKIRVKVENILKLSRERNKSPRHIALLLAQNYISSKQKR